MRWAKENEVKRDIKIERDKRELMWGRCCGWLGWQGCSRWVVGLGHSLGECYRGAFQGGGSSHKRPPVYSKERAHCVSCTASHIPHPRPLDLLCLIAPSLPLLLQTFS